LVQQAGGAVLSLLTTDTGLDIRAVVSRDGVEKILGAALEAAAEHPEVFGVEGNAGLTRILGEVAGALAEYPKLVSTDVLPEIARLLLERTGENLELLWPGGAEDPKKHLLLVAVKSTLAALSAGASDGGAWKLRFGSADVLDVVESVVDDLAANPAWLLSGAGKIEEGLATAITATLAVIRKRGDAKLFSPAIASAVLRAAVTAVATRREFLALPGGAGKPIVAAAVDVVLSAILDPDLDLDAKWQLLRDESVVGAVSLSLEVLGDTTVTSEGVERLRGVWEDVVDDLKEGGALDFDKIEAELRAAL
jgi:hypothetical protein